MLTPAWIRGSCKFIFGYHNHRNPLEGKLGATAICWLSRSAEEWFSEISTLKAPVLNQRIYSTKGHTYSHNEADCARALILLVEARTLHYIKVRRVCWQPSCIDCRQTFPHMYVSQPGYREKGYLINILSGLLVFEVCINLSKFAHVLPAFAYIIHLRNTTYRNTGLVQHVHVQARLTLPCRYMTSTCLSFDEQRLRLIMV